MVTLPVTLGDPNFPNHLISTFCVAFCIFVLVEVRDFKFVVPVHRMDDQLPERGVVMSRDPFLIFSPPKISLERLKLQTSNFVQWLAMSTISL